jgi:hypothetical protein
MMADGGSLFLDEVDALPLTAQAKLLRFLQERTFKPLGSDRFVQADVNVIACDQSRSRCARAGATVSIGFVLSAECPVACISYRCDRGERTFLCWRAILSG